MKYFYMCLLFLASCGNGLIVRDIPVPVPAAPVAAVNTPPVHCEVFTNTSNTSTPLVNMVPSVYQVRGDYGVDLPSISLGTQNDPTLPFDSFKQTAGATLTTNFALRCNFMYDVTLVGTHKFTLTSDDGSAMLVDGVSKIVNDGPHALSTKTANVTFTASQLGNHEIVVLYAQGDGPKALTLTVQTPAPPAAPSSNL